MQIYAEGGITRAGATATTCPNIRGGVNFFPTAYTPTTGIACGAGSEGCSDLAVKEVAVKEVAVKEVAVADVHSGAV